MTPALLVASKRDPRIDVLRGIALVMIFVDHIPGNTRSAWLPCAILASLMPQRYGIRAACWNVVNASLW